MRWQGPVMGQRVPFTAAEDRRGPGDPVSSLAQGNMGKIACLCSWPLFKGLKGIVFKFYLRYTSGSRPPCPEDSHMVPKR